MKDKEEEKCSCGSSMFFFDDKDNKVHCCHCSNTWEDRRKAPRIQELKKDWL